MALWDQILGGFVGVLILGAIFVPIERKWPLIRRKLLRPMWKTDVAHVAFTGILDSVFSVVGIVAAWLLVGWWAPAGIVAVVSAQPNWAQFLQVFILGNLIGYWAHRLSHTVPLLWRFHKIHHSSRHMDWLAAARRHPLEQTWNGLIVGVFLIFLGFQVQQIAAVEVFNVLWGIFLHANTNLRFRRLRHVIATPEFHHWHHSSDPARYNTNYSLFPWLDALFGTKYLPEERATEFGVPDFDPPGYIGQMIEPFRRRKAEPDEGPGTVI